jgi:hypothetical protein
MLVGLGQDCPAHVRYGRQLSGTAVADRALGNALVSGMPIATPLAARLLPVTATGSALTHKYALCVYQWRD